jgi:acetyl esterase/lipase
MNLKTCKFTPINPTPMKRIFTLLSIGTAVLSGGSVTAQRYLEEVFPDVQVTTGVVYGNNASVLAYQIFNEAIPEDLLLDVYEPVGDEETARPVILYFHTGNFLPHPQNGGTGGLRTDSATVEICRRFARMGYVVASCDYRLGWNPIAPTQEERVNTLINAAYRGVQDCRTAVRFFRKTAAENDNPYGIDPDKIAVWGQGTGGYISFAAATINDYLDIVLPKFIRQVEISPGVFVPVPMVIEEVNGDIYGTSYGINPGEDPESTADDDTLCYINHAGYSSAFNVAVNMGGACGDISWVGGDDGPMISFQVPTDPFAPYTTGTLIVPGFNLPVVEVSGAYDVQAVLNQFGNNDVFLLADDYAPGLPYTLAANALNEGYNGLFPLVRPDGMESDSSPWEYWAASNPNNNNGLLSNPDMSELKAKTFIDTIQGYTAPRLACALDLPSNPCTGIGVNELKNVKLAVYPNPAREQITLRSTSPMEMVSIFDLAGKRVFFRSGLNTSSWNMSEGLPASGVYMIEVLTSSGRAVERLIIE